MPYLYAESESGLGCLGQPARPVTPSLTGPARIQRGTQANYVVANTPQGATFSNWRFARGSLSVPRIGNNNVSNWQGTMVQGGTVNVDVTIGTTTRILSRVVAVTPRPWTENAPAVPLPRTGHGHLPVQPRLNRPGVDPRDPGLGITDIREVHLVQIMIVNAGPNTGFNYLPAPPVTWTPQAFTNEALYDPAHPFYRAHDTRGRSMPLPRGRPEIGQIQLNVEAHEGIVLPPLSNRSGYSSHWQRALTHLTDPTKQINIPLERDVSHKSNETNSKYAERVKRFVNAGIAAVQNATRPHPKDIRPGTPYFNYPYIEPRGRRMRVNDRPTRLALSNPRGGRVSWASVDRTIATVDAGGVVSPIAPGRTTIRVTNADGDVDEIPVNVEPALAKKG